MVEGPGATRNGRKVQPAIGSKVKEIKSTRVLSKEYRGRILQEAFSVGKELFLIFADEVSGEENALRLLSMAAEPRSTIQTASMASKGGIFTNHHNRA